MHINANEIQLITFSQVFCFLKTPETKKKSCPLKRTGLQTSIPNNVRYLLNTIRFTTDFSPV